MDKRINLGIVIVSTSFILTVILGYLTVPILKKLKANQITKEIGPTWHKKKTGTPTMGGIFLMFGIVASCFLAIISLNLFKMSTNFKNIFLTPQETTKFLATIICAIGMGLIGFADDYLKIIHKQNKGLSAMQKTLMQLLIIFGYFITLKINGCISTIATIPIFGQVDFGFFYYIISVVGMHGVVNAVNLTDGLDGLVSSVTAVYAMFFVMITFILNIFSMFFVACALLGGCLGFLVWNFFPAKVFMGDTGSMFLGGLVATLGFGVNEPFLILVVGIIYIIEAMSVVIQVIYFKLTHGKRIFKMSPIHHHFEMCGFSEVKILILFCFITLIFGIIGVNFIKNF